MITNIDDDEIILWVQQKYSPEQIFDEDELAYWAEHNGYIKKLKEEINES